MKLYADSKVRGALQLLGDVLLLVWVAVWVKVALVVRDVTLTLAVPGERMADASGGLAQRLREAGQSVGDVPVVGDEVRAPFDGAGAAAEQLAAAGRAQASAATDLAFWLGLAVGAIPILIALAVYLPPRIRFVREATAGQRFVDAAADLDLFALRAMSRQPMHKLARISDDPSGAWRAGDQQVIRRLAELELHETGLAYRGR
jgi:hypothetical protein